jgi:hypothetical protein
MRIVRHGLAALTILLATALAALAAEPDINGLWRGSIYGSDVQAQVEQSDHDVKAEVVIHSLTGETNVYHVVGVMMDGHVILVHGSGHVFDGHAEPGEISGVLTTKGGSKVEVKASRVLLEPNGQGSSRQGAAVAGTRRPG